MSTYAILNNNKVENVIICDDDKISSISEFFVKVTEDTSVAAIGMTYDAEINKFLSAKPYESWVLNSDFIWESPEGPNPNPIAKFWDESTLSWTDR
jgi:hypothetical protein